MGQSTAMYSMVESDFQDESATVTPDARGTLTPKSGISLNEEIQYPPVSPVASSTHQNTVCEPPPYRRPKTLWQYLVDLVVIVLTVGLVVFVVFVGTQNGRELDTRYAFLRGALTTLGPLFPFIFASASSRLLFQVACNRLERGTSIGALEQLTGSYTLGSTIKTLFDMRLVNHLSILLLSLWLLSPLGGQSFLRILGEGTQSRPGSDVEFIELAGFDQNVDPKGAFFTLFYSPEAIKSSPQDPWGNVKIPFLEHSTDKVEPDWNEFDTTTRKPAYSSLAGVPTRNIPIGNTSLTLESEYISLSCDTPTLDQEPSDEPGRSLRCFDCRPFPLDIKNESTGTTMFSKVQTELKSLASLIDHTGSGFNATMLNGTWYGGETPQLWSYRSKVGDMGSEAFPIWWYIGVDRLLDEHWVHKQARMRNPLMRPSKFFENDTDVEALPTQLLFQARTILNNLTEVGMYKTKCRVLTKYVESRVQCVHSSIAPPACQVTAQRPSRRAHPSEDISWLSFPQLLLEEDISFAEIRPWRYKADPVLFHIFDPHMKMYGEPDKEWSAPDFTKLSPTAFSIGLSQVINSWFTVGQLDSRLFQSNWDLRSGDLDAKSSSREVEAYKVQIGRAETTISYPVYQIHWPWWAACLLCCVVLALVGIAGTFYAHRGKGPQSLGFVSTILRDSRHVSLLAPELCHMDGGELSRLVKNERIRFGYVDGEGQSLGIGREQDIMGLNESRGTKRDGGLSGDS